MTQKNFYLHKLWSDIRHLPTRNKFLLGGFLFILIAGGFFLGSGLGSPKIEEANSDDVFLKQVSLATVRELSQDKEPIRVLGEVTSQSEAGLRAEAQGRVTSVRVSEGQRVSRGQVIATIESGAQEANVAQARAAVASARASIGTSQTLSQVGLQSSEQILREAKVAALNSVKNAYSQIDDAIRGQADTLFINPETTNPSLSFIVSSNQQLGEKLGIGRRNMTKVLSEWKLSINGLTEQTVSAADLDAVQQYAEEVRLFLSDLVTASLGVQSTESISPAQISAWKTAASGSRSSVNSVISSLSAVRNSLVQAEANVQISTEQTSQTNLSGNTTAQASLAQAEAALRSAQLNLAKTIILSPFNGVVTRLDIEVGDFVSMLEPVAVVSSDQALEIIAYLNDSEKDFVGEGSTVIIGQNGISGQVIQVSPTIDTSTQKIEVKISPSTSAGLTDGQSVLIAIQRSLEDPDQILVPLGALKVLAEGFSVLVLDDSGITQPVPVSIGPVVGDRVLIYEGLSLDVQIIEDVRGIKVGEKVIVVSE